MKTLCFALLLSFVFLYGCQNLISCSFDLVTQSYNGDEFYKLSSSSDSIHFTYDLVNDGSRLLTLMNMGKKKDTTIYGGEMPEKSKGDYDRIQIDQIKGDTVNFRIQGKTDSNSVNYIVEHKIVQGSYDGFLKGDTIVLEPTSGGYQVYHNELKKIFTRSLQKVMQEGSFKIEEKQQYLEEKISMSKSSLIIHLKTLKPNFLRFSGILKPEYCY